MTSGVENSVIVEIVDVISNITLDSKYELGNDANSILRHLMISIAL